MKLWQLVAQKALKMNSATPSTEKIPDGRIKIKIEKVMLTADDALLYSGALPVKYPFILGTYAVGKVSEPAKDVTDYPRSMRVVMRCTKRGRDGETNFFGRNFSGYLRDFITVTCDDFYPIPPSITDEEALFMGLIAQAEAVIAKISPDVGDIVAVMGGSVLSVIICQTLLSGKVIPIYIDSDSGRQNIARACGIFYTLTPDENLISNVNQITGGRMCNGGIYSYTGNSAPANDLFKLVSDKATIVFTGDSVRPVNLSFYDITKKSLTLCGVYSGDGYELSALNRIINKTVDLTAFKRRTSPDSLLPEACERLCDSASNGNSLEIITL